MNIDYTVQIWKEGRQYVAHAMPLDLASAGETPDAARRALDEAVHVFIDTCGERGTLTQVLEECGYQSGGNGSWRSPEWISVEHRTLATTP